MAWLVAWSIAWAGVARAQDAAGSEAGPDEGADASASVESEAGADAVGETAAGVSASSTEQAEADEGDDEPLPWRGSTFLWDHAVGVTTFGGYLSYNPSYAWSFSFRPRYYVTRDLSVRLRQDLFYELTDTDTYTYNRELVVANPIVSFGGKLLTVGSGSLSGTTGLVFPVSKETRAQRGYLAWLASAGLTYPFEWLEGLELSGTLSYSHAFNGSNQRHAEEGFPGRVVALPSRPGRDEPTTDALGGASNTTDTFGLTLGASLRPFEALHLDLQVGATWAFGGGLAPGRYACTDVVTAACGSGEVGLVLEDGSRTHMRLSRTFSIGAGYDVTKWLDVSLSLVTASPEFDSDGTREDFFYNEFSAVSLTATVALDEAYQAFVARPATERASSAGRRAARAAGRARW